MARATPHDLFEIETLFEELCLLLESVQINLKGLFLNADSGFDAQNLRLACEQRKIQANIAANPRSAVSQTTEWTYFDRWYCREKQILN